MEGQCLEEVIRPDPRANENEMLWGDKKELLTFLTRHLPSNIQLPVSTRKTI